MEKSINPWISVVLVRTIYPSNIGAAARAVANMGAHRLILIDPHCEINSKAKQGAAGAQEALESLKIYKDWPDFYQSEGSGLRLALTRRSGKLRPPLDLRQAIQRQKPFMEAGDLTHIYLVFGPEDDGLSSDDLAFVNLSCQLPTYGPFPSLNLAQAVLLALYICQSGLESFSLSSEHPPSPCLKPLYFPDQSLQDWLTAMGFDIKARRSSAYLTLRRLLLQNQPTNTELQVLEAILQQNIRKLKER